VAFTDWPPRSASSLSQILVEDCYCGPPRAALIVLLRLLQFCSGSTVRFREPMFLGVMRRFADRAPQAGEKGGRPPCGGTGPAAAYPGSGRRRRGVQTTAQSENRIYRYCCDCSDLAPIFSCCAVRRLETRSIAAYFSFVLLLLTSHPRCASR